MGESQLIGLIAPLGVGGILAYVMFNVYRKDAKEWVDRWHGQSESLMEIVKENTSAVTELIALVRRLPPVDCPLSSREEVRK